MARRGSTHGWIAAAVIAAALQAAPALAQQTGQGVSGGPGVPTPADAATDILISAVEVRLDGRTGSAEADEALRLAVRQALGVSPGTFWNGLLAEVILQRVRAIPGVQDARAQIIQQPADDTIALVVTVIPGEAGEVRIPRGALQTGKADDLPVLYRDGATYVRLLLDGGLGVFSDGNPWFGQPETFTKNNPLVLDPAVGAQTPARADWTEGYVQFGAGGVTPLGDGPLYLYGAVTGMAPWAAGNDIFRDDPRATLNLEKAYAGVLYAPDDRDLRINASVGRQTFDLNDGFLLSRFSAQWNAGPRPGVYLAPRTALDMSALLTVSSGPWVSTTFYLDPNEEKLVDSHTRTAGTNLRYNFSDRVSVDATWYTVPASDTLYPVPGGPPLGREGLNTIAAHWRWSDPAALPGVWAETEVAHQWNANFPMSGWAGYGTVGYIARGMAWTPSLSYRFAGFSGDDPDTATYERYDSLYSGGLAEWLQGITINKVLSQANRLTHRVRLNVSPDDSLNLTFDYFWHRADDLNNLGGNPALSALESYDLGQEAQFVARWAASRNVFVMGVASIAMPGEAIEDATNGKAVPWTTLQAQVFWNF